MNNSILNILESILKTMGSRTLCFFLCLFIGILFNLNYGQTVIKGKVISKDKSPVEYAMITLMEIADSTILGYTTTDETGCFEIKCTSTASQLLFRLSGLNVKWQYKKIANKSETIDCVAEEESHQLKEVLVKAQKMWGKDTLNYLVSAFINKDDATIGDILKRLPGITVDNGAIKYNGVAINKFYIENMDVLQGRYNIATNGIAAKDVSTVQVLEHHQAVKALADQSPPEAAAINLKLKDAKKGIWSGHAELGAGYDEGALWNNELMATYFGKTRQHIITYQNANTGEDITGQLTSFYNGSELGSSTLTSMLMPAAAEVDSRRGLFNNAHVVTLNNLKKFKNDFQLHYNLVYSHDIDRGNSYSSTTYQIPGEEARTLIERNSSRMTTNRLETEVSYEQNRDKRYVSNKFTLAGDWADGHGLIASTEDIHQQSNSYNLGFSASTEYVLRTDGGKGFRLKSENSFQTHPHWLKISPGVYPDILNDSTTYSTTEQNVRINELNSSNFFTLLSTVKYGPFSLNPEMRLDVNHTSMHSDLYIDEHVASDSLRNRMEWTKVNAGMGMELKVLSGGFSWSVSCPLDYRLVFMDNRLKSRNLNRSRIYFSPSTFIQWKMGDNTEMNVRAGRSTSSTGWESLYTGYILNSYRTLNRYEDKIFDSRNYYATGSLSYKSVFDMFFAKIGGSISRRESDVLYGSYYTNEMLSVTQVLEVPNHSTSYGVNGSINKGFDWKKLMLKVAASWRGGNSQYLRQSQLTGYHSEGYSVSGTITMKPLKWFSYEYAGSYSESRSHTDYGAATAPIRYLTNKVTGLFELSKTINIYSEFEHYYNSAVEGDRNFSLLDLSVNFHIHGHSFSVKMNNVLNTQKFVTASNSNMIFYYSECYIRPRALMVSTQIYLKN